MNINDKIFLAGHNGMVGSAINRLLAKEGYQNVLTITRKELDLRNSEKVKSFLKANRPDYIIIAAAKVGGIAHNIKAPVEFLLDNITIQNNLITNAVENNAKKIIFLGSSCIYPRECKQPMKEEYIMSGPLEPTNEGYALAKITGLRLLQYYAKEYGIKSLNLMPCNLYGTNDSFDLEKSHVLSALVKKFVDAHDDKKDTVEIWGSGIARREFMHVDDLAEGLLYLENNWDSSDIINIGSGVDISIKELSNLISSLIGYKGKIYWNTQKPEGMMRKCLDITRMKSIGYTPRINLEEGIIRTIKEYREIRNRVNI